MATKSIIEQSVATWRDGWWADALICPSPNQEARPAGVQIDLLIVHAISLPPGEYGTAAIADLFTNRLDWDAHPYFQALRGLRVSSHFLIRRDGQVLQFVSADARAWHAGQSSWRGRSNCNDYSIGVELEGLVGNGFDPAQYKRLAQLTCAVKAQYPGLAEVVGHEHVAPQRKQDPGCGFDWSAYASAVVGSGIKVWSNCG